MKPKVCMTKKEQIEYWTQKYLGAKQSGDSKMMKIYEACILKLGGKIPRL